MGQGNFGLRAAPKVMTSAGRVSSRWRHERAPNLAHSPEHSPNNTTHVTTFTYPYGRGGVARILRHEDAGGGGGGNNQHNQYNPNMPTTGRR